MQQAFVVLKLFSLSMFVTVSVSIKEFELNKDTFIIGGSTASPGEFPFVVFMRYIGSEGEEFDCGGSIISKKWILTAAHCAYAYVDKPLLGKLPGYAMTGTNSLTHGGVAYNISYAVMHPKFDPYVNGGPFDIGLVQLHDEIKLNNFTQPIEISKIVPPDESLVTSVGWGYTDHNKSQPDLLKKLTLRTMNLHKCAEIYKINQNEEPICTLAHKGEGLCKLDSGGPLVYEKKLVGVLANGASPCDGGLPNAFSNAIYYHHWIYNITGLGLGRNHVESKFFQSRRRHNQYGQ